MSVFVSFIPFNGEKLEKYVVTVSRIHGYETHVFTYVNVSVLSVAGFKYKFIFCEE